MKKQRDAKTHVHIAAGFCVAPSMALLAPLFWINTPMAFHQFKHSTL